MTFETAEREVIAGRTPPPLNFVVVGAGPTGVELAGAISDIAGRHLTNEFRAIDPRQSRIILLEGGPRVLPTYPEDLSASAERQLKEMGVEVRTNAMVTNIEPGVVSVGKEKIPASVILWGAGVSASPLGKMLGVPTDKAGRVIVERDLTVPGHPEVFVTGDLASARRRTASQFPALRQRPSRWASLPRARSGDRWKASRARRLSIWIKAAWPRSDAHVPSPILASSISPAILPGWHGCSFTCFS